MISTAIIPNRFSPENGELRTALFTGIVEEVGHIAKIEQRGENRRLTVEASGVTKELKTGNSVAVSGVCLTALDITSTTFCADLAPETWVRTSFSRITEGALVNLELPLRTDGRMGGHMVQGHVDGVGKLLGFDNIPGTEDYWLHIEVPQELEKYFVYKGSVSIEGISLTVAKLEGLKLSVAIIPHTVEMTNLKTLKPGDPVNLEADIVAKYLEKWFRAGREERGLTVEALAAKGF
ncbi:MAG: riboflavin synthase [Terriglobia bacterium]|nr:riboflavin synthase [Terriglobia bacterium]